MPTRSHGAAGCCGEQQLRTESPHARTPTHTRHTLLLSATGQRPLCTGPQLPRRLRRPSVARVTMDQSGYQLSAQVLPGVSAGRSPRAGGTDADAAGKEQLFTQLRPSRPCPAGRPRTKPRGRRKQDQTQSSKSLTRSTEEPVPGLDLPCLRLGGRRHCPHTTSPRPGGRPPPACTTARGSRPRGPPVGDLGPLSERARSSRDLRTGPLCPPAPRRVQLWCDNRRKHTARPAGGGSAGIPSSGCSQTDAFQVNFSPIRQTQARSGTPTQGHHPSQEQVPSSYRFSQRQTRTSQSENTVSSDESQKQPEGACGGDGGPETRASRCGRKGRCCFQALVWGDLLQQPHTFPVPARTPAGSQVWNHTCTIQAAALPPE